MMPIWGQLHLKTPQQPIVAMVSSLPRAATCPRSCAACCTSFTNTAVMVIASL